jgi:hypothetical protein
VNSNFSELFFIKPTAIASALEKADISGGSEARIFFSCATS